MSRAPRHPTSGALRGLAFIALLAALAGCATQPPAHSGRATGGLPPPPNAAGAVVGEFQMADGRVGYLYMNGRRYSLAVPGYRTTLPVHGSPARIRSSEAVGGRTVVLLEVSNPGCDNELVVGVLRGNEVLSWTIGDCRNSPAITVGRRHAHDPLHLRGRTPPAHRGRAGPTVAHAYSRPAATDDALSTERAGRWRRSPEPHSPNGRAHPPCTQRPNHLQR